MGADLTVVALDVTDISSVENAVRDIESVTALDVLINNAGSMPAGVTEAFTPAQVQECFDVNYMGIVRTTRALLPAMRSRGSGLIISLSSAAGRLAIPYFGVYCASKWAMEAYCESLHHEAAPLGIESILVEPSGHGTDLVRTSPAPSDDQVLASYGPLSDGRERLLNMFQTQFDAGEPATDAANVARAIADLVEQPAPRPLRTQVGHDMGVEAINAAAAPIQKALLDQLRPVYE